MGPATAANLAAARSSFLPKIEFARDPVRHDFLDSFLEIRPGYAGYTRQRRFDIELANVENPFGVYLRLGTLHEYFFVTGAFPLFEPRRDYRGDERGTIHAL